jgi:uncharacterized glyoxalase superfamily protein PhnB
MQTMYPYLRYRDVTAAADFLSTAFGFRLVPVPPSPHGHANHTHVEMEVDADSRLRMTPFDPDEAAAAHASVPSFLLQISVSDIDAHFTRAQAAGATVVRALRERRYGDRGYVVDDPEGQRWYFIERESG